MEFTRRGFLGLATVLTATPVLAAPRKVFEPVMFADAKPLEDELKKYPRCMVCGMEREKFHFNRHLLHCKDLTVWGTCSPNCLAAAMLHQRRRGFEAVYAPDEGVGGTPRPLFLADNALYLIGSDLRAVMSRVSKYAFTSPAAAQAARTAHGGEIVSLPTMLSMVMAEHADSLATRYLKRHEKKEPYKVLERHGRS